MNTDPRILGWTHLGKAVPSTVGSALKRLKADRRPVQQFESRHLGVLSVICRDKLGILVSLPLVRLNPRWSSRVIQRMVITVDVKN